MTKCLLPAHLGLAAMAGSAVLSALHIETLRTGRNDGRPPMGTSRLDHRRL